ncbi:hypothetical protein BDZ91DRAFT_102901 [Kalaharituber pfeilii]|nr:hypothetical protein BDZ91DRAFT_102901 [Kalaharituber pfeilii]
MAPKKQKKAHRQNAPSSTVSGGLCQAITPSNEQCDSAATSATGKQRFCAQHAEEYSIFYLRYKELQAQLEELKLPEAHSVGETGHVKAIPMTKAGIETGRQKTVLQSLKR